MSKTWKTGAPPSIGWWPASLNRQPDVLRWWDGKVWSAPAYPTMTAKQAACRAAMPSSLPPHIDVRLIEYQDRPHNWPQASKA